MAKPKGGARKGSGRKKGERPPRKIILTFKGYEEFDEWVRGLAKELRMPVSVVMEIALVEFAKARGYIVPPPER